jgi:hypothetical protein
MTNGPGGIDTGPMGKPGLQRLSALFGRAQADEAPDRYPSASDV